MRKQAPEPRDGTLDPSGPLLSGRRRFRGWTDRHPRAQKALGFLRAHWLETIALASVAGLILAVDPAKLAAAYRALRVPYLLLMVPTVLAVYVFRGVGWWIALRRLGVEIGVLRAIVIMFAGQTLVFMPTGDLARVALLRETGASGKDEGTLAGSITFQELLLMTLLGLGVLPRVFSQPGIALLVLLMTALHGLVFTILIWRPAYEGAVRLVERISLLRRFDRQLRSLRPAFMAMLSPRSLLGVTVCNALAAASMFALFQLALRAVGVNSVDVVETAFVYGLAHLLGGLSFLPSGMGSTEAIAVALLAGRGVAPAAGAAAAVLYRCFNDVLMALVGLLAAWVLRRRRWPAGRS